METPEFFINEAGHVVSQQGLLTQCIEYTDASLLLMLFCFFDIAAVHNDVFTRGGKSQKHWNKAGEMDLVPPSLVHEDISDVLTNDSRLEKALDTLAQASLLHFNSVSNEWTMSSQTRVGLLCGLPGESLVNWKCQALLVLCHGFPRDRYLDSRYVLILARLPCFLLIRYRYGEIGRALLPQLKYLLQDSEALVNSQRLTSESRREVALTLLSASEFSDLDWKKLAIKLAKQFMPSKDSYFDAFLVFRESVVHRALFEDDKAKALIEEFFGVLRPSDDPRTNAQIGYVLLSLAKIHIRWDQPNKAAPKLGEWKPLDSAQPSTMERIVMCEINITLGNILRYSGQFQEASSYLEKVLSESLDERIFDALCCDIQCGLADSYCELDRSVDARNLLQNGLKRLEDTGSCHTNKSTRLYLSLAETYMRESRLGEADDIFQHLQAQTSNDPRRTKMQSIRLFIGLARVAHLREECLTALGHWTEALKIMSSFSLDGGPITRVMHYSVSDVLSKLGWSELSERSFFEAEKPHDPLACVHYYAGVNTYWFEHVRSQRSKQSS